MSEEPPVFPAVAEATWTAFYSLGAGSTGVGTRVEAKILMILNFHRTGLWALKPSTKDSENNETQLHCFLSFLGFRGGAGKRGSL